MITKPNYNEIINRIRADIASYLPDVDPTIFGSFIRALSDSLAGRSFDVILLLDQLEKELFPQTASGEYLERWAHYEALTRNPATSSSGLITITGLGTIDINTELTSEDGNIYTTDEEIILTNQNSALSSLTRSGSVVTGTTASSHYLASNQTVTISNATEDEYNGDFQITVLSETTFTYNIDDTPSSPATGSPNVSFNGGSVNVTSQDQGLDLNIDSGGKLILSSPIVGVDTNCYVQYTKISGGTDAETDEDLLVRVMQSRSNPVANFNSAAIEKIVRTIPGVTRVWIQHTTPNIGDVTIYFVRDNNETTIIPDAGEINTVKDKILEIKPANTSDSAVYVYAPTPITTDYTFSAINPDTSTMRTAIENSLTALYEDSVTFGENITEDKYRSAIIDTIDLETGDSLISFTLTTPTTDITIDDGEIGILGDITYN